MQKQTKKLLGYLLTLAIAFSSTFTGQIVTKTTGKAATLTQAGIAVTETTDTVSVETNEEGQESYALTSDVAGGLELELSGGETVVLDGNGFLITGKDADDARWIESTPALKVSGEGTLILKNIRLQGGAGRVKEEFFLVPSPGLVVQSSEISLVLQETYGNHL